MRIACVGDTGARSPILRMTSPPMSLSGVSFGARTTSRPSLVPKY